MVPETFGEAWRKGGMISGSRLVGSEKATEFVALFPMRKQIKEKNFKTCLGMDSIICFVNLPKLTGRSY